MASAIHRWLWQAWDGESVIIVHMGDVTWLCKLRVPCVQAVLVMHADVHMHCVVLHNQTTAAVTSSATSVVHSRAQCMRHAASEMQDGAPALLCWVWLRV
jgi:hypothetical protein